MDLLVVGLTALAAIAAIQNAVASDRRRAGDAAVSASIAGYDKTYLVVVNLGPADACDITVTLEEGDERLTDAARSWRTRRRRSLSGGSVREGTTRSDFHGCC